VVKIVSTDAQGKKIYLSQSEIGQELTTIKNKKILPGPVIDKLNTKLQNLQISLTRNQLYELVNKINTALKKYNNSKTDQSNMIHLPNEVPAQISTFSDESIKQNSMQQLIETLDKIEQRLTLLEETTKQKNNTDQTSASDQIDPLNELSNGTEHIVVLMKWLQYLVDKTGKTQLPEILTYYVDIGWISDDVRLDMIDYAKGITDVPLKDGTKKSTYQLTTRDHIQSLLFIQKLKGQQLDERFISKIDREMQKMERSIDQYQNR
jgi:archaeal flagellar protein FlaD